MSIWARAIIFGVELVGFLALCIFAVVKFYKENYLKEDKKFAVKELKFDLMYCSINFIVILALFLLSFPSYVFFSYNKLILVSVFVLLSTTIILYCLIKKNIILVILILLGVATFAATIIISGLMVMGEIDIECKTVLFEQKQTETIAEPTIFYKNQIGYTTDDEGNIASYMFYYQDHGKWKYVDVSAKEVQKEEIKGEDSYIEETVTRISYCKQEKKPFDKEHIYVEENKEYVVYYNPSQMVEIEAK